jgi:hypothetical protein
MRRCQEKERWPPLPTTSGDVMRSNYIRHTVGLSLPLWRSRPCTVDNHVWCLWTSRIVHLTSNSE